MTYTVLMQRLDPYSHELFFEVVDPDQNVVASIKKDKNSKTILNYKDSSYEFPFSIKSVARAEFPFPYPISGKKNKKLGYHVLKDGEVAATYYSDSAVVEKKMLFSKRIGFTVFQYNGGVCVVIKVGLPSESSHYYCLIEANSGKTVGMVERLQSNPEEARGKIHFTDPALTELLLMLVASEMVMVVTSSAEGQIIDPSAGKYISALEEERNFFDKNFLDFAKTK